VPADVKILLQNYPSILRTGDVKPTPTHGVEHHIHTGSHPQFLQNPIALIRKNLRLPKRNSKGWYPLALFVIQIAMGLSFAHGPQKRQIMAALWILPSFELDHNPLQIPTAE
jgi:hypothetical protein